MPTAIITWHSLDESGSPISTSPRKFLAQLDALRQSGVPIVPLADLPNHRQAVALTFDHGLRSFHTHALPALLEHNLPATIFVVNRYVGKTNTWPTQPPATVVLPLLDWSQIIEAKRAGIEVGSYTATHPRLYALSHLDQMSEIVEAKAELEDRLSSPVTSFAYPYGKTDARSRLLVAQHFTRAVTTSFGYVQPAQQPLELPRLDVASLGHPLWLSALFTPAGRSWVGARRLARVVRLLA